MHMPFLNKYIFIFFISLTVAFVGCKPAKEIVQQIPSVSQIDDSQPLQKSLLWKIEGNGIKNVSYLYGTIHMIPGDDFFLPIGTSSALSNASNIYFEVDMDDMMNIGKQIKLLTKAFMKDGTRLKDLLSPEDYKLVKSKFESLGLPFMLFERVKPMFLSMFVQGDFNPEDLQNGSITSYEMEFYETAKENEIPVDGLETLEFQMSIFDSIPYSDQAKMLVESIRSTNIEDDEFQKMIELYKAQDVDGMYDMFQGEDVDIGEYEDLFLTTRNKNWIPIMQNVLPTGNLFFAVGAGHLGGPNGVIRLLRKAGYTVTPVKSEISSRQSKKI